jgi:hypothetical protein
MESAALEDIPDLARAAAASDVSSSEGMVMVGMRLLSVRVGGAVLRRMVTWCVT